MRPATTGFFSETHSSFSYRSSRSLLSASTHSARHGSFSRFFPRSIFRCASHRLKKRKGSFWQSPARRATTYNFKKKSHPKLRGWLGPAFFRSRVSGFVDNQQVAHVSKERSARHLSGRL